MCKPIAKLPLKKTEKHNNSLRRSWKAIEHNDATPYGVFAHDEMTWPLPADPYLVNHRIRMNKPKPTANQTEDVYMYEQPVIAFHLRAGNVIWHN